MTRVKIESLLSHGAFLGEVEAQTGRSILANAMHVAFMLAVRDVMDEWELSPVQMSDTQRSK